MKIVLSQLNYHIGNFTDNTAKIISSIEKAKSEKADLVVFSELSVCGYPPLDLLEQKDFIENCRNSSQEIASYCTDIAAIIGLPVINRNEKGKKLFNTAAFCSDGKIQELRYKTLLPTYDIFDEYRYFEPNTDFNIIEYKGKKIALTICEDLWDEQPVENSFARETLYRQSPMDELAKQLPDVMINISASPFSFSQYEKRQEVLAQKTKKFNIPLVYVNQVGANTEIIFDGGSAFISSEGKVVEQCKFFEEDFKIIDLDSELSIKQKDKPENKIEKIHDALVLGISDYFRKMGFNRATLGLSGGIDSAVTLVLAQRALGSENIRVLLLPSRYSSDHSVNDAVKLAENLNIQYDILSIEPIFNEFENSFTEIFKGKDNDVTEENIQARVRGTMLMAISNKFGHILLNTSNKSEAAVGYGTLYGDMNGGLAVLGDVYKKDVFALAGFMNKDREIIPENTITKPPSAELRPDQKDSDSLPDYDVLDDILFNYIELKKTAKEIAKLGYDIALVKKVIRMVNINEYKRFQAPPVLRISTKAFGSGRRIPLVARY